MARPHPSAARRPSSPRRRGAGACASPAATPPGSTPTMSASAVAARTVCGCRNRQGTLTGQRRDHTGSAAAADRERPADQRELQRQPRPGDGPHGSGRSDQSRAIFTFAGKTATNSPAAAAAPSRRVRGAATAAATPSSAIPEASVQNRGVPGRRRGTIRVEGSRCDQVQHAGGGQHGGERGGAGVAGSHARSVPRRVGKATFRARDVLNVAFRATTRNRPDPDGVGPARLGSARGVPAGERPEARPFVGRPVAGRAHPHARGRRGTGRVAAAAARRRPGLALPRRADRLARRRGLRRQQQRQPDLVQRRLLLRDGVALHHRLRRHRPGLPASPAAHHAGDHAAAAAVPHRPGRHHRRAPHRALPAVVPHFALEVPRA